MYKTLFPHTNIHDLNKSINKKMLHTYNNSYTPQIDIYRVTMSNAGIEYPCNFFIVQGKRPELLG